jgi:hypothetical protein
MPGSRATAGALAAALCAVALAACGDDDQGTIPEDQGQAMLDQVATVESLVDQGECNDARSAAVGFTQQVDELPDEVDREVQAALVEAGANLVELTQNPDQCEPVVTGPSGVAETVPDEEEETPEQTLPDEETPEEETEQPEETPLKDTGGETKTGGGSSNGEDGGDTGSGSGSTGGIGSGGG